MIKNNRKGRKVQTQRAQKSLCALCEKLSVLCGKNFKHMKILKNIPLISNYICLISAVAFTAVLPFYFVHQRVVVAIFFISYILDFILNKQWNSFRKDKSMYVFIGFIFFFLLVPFYHLFESSSRFYIDALEVYLPFLCFGIIGLFGYNRLFKLRYFAYTTIITSFALICFLVVKTIGIQEFIALPFTEKMMLFAFKRIEYINNHMIFNIYMNVSFIFVFYLLFSEEKIISRWGKIIVAIIGVVIYYALFISDGRTGFITGNLILLFFLLKYIVNKRKWILGTIAAVALLCIAIFIIQNHSRMQKDEIDKEPRLYIWEIAEKTILEKPILGHGASDGREVFLQKGIENVDIIEADNIKEDFIIGKAHPHNQYLQSLISFGAIGLLSLIFIFISPIIISIKQKQIWFYLALFVSIFVIQSCFEIFGVGLSAIIYTFFITLFFQQKNQSNTNYKRLL